MNGKIMEIMPHTMFFTIGPSNSGKTYFCREYLLPQLEALPPLPNREKVQVTYISSDDARRELWGQDFHKYHPAMLAASKPAFDLLFQRLKSAMMFPVSSEFIVVDTKGTSEAFREDLFLLAEEYNYGVIPILFNYSDYDEYGKYAPMDRRTMVDIKKTRAAMVGLRKNKAVKGVMHLKSSDFAKAPALACQNHELLRRCVLSNDREMLVVSDIHSCYGEFLELLQENKIKVETHRITENAANKKLVLAGDYLDSGPQIEDMIDFCFENNDVAVVIGNHEQRLYKELTQGLAHIEAPYFDSFYRLDEEHKERFIKVFERSLPFVRNDYAIVTHAPCPAAMLGKLDDESRRRQRYCLHGREADASLYSELDSMGVFADDIGSMLHIFGHIPTTTPGRVIDGRMLIDGGCVLGGKLTSVSMAADGRNFVKSVPSRQPRTEGESQPRKYMKPESRQDIDLSEFSFADRERIRKMATDKVNFLSGTMSPCDKMGDELESIESGLDYFRRKGITDIVMEPKYMGSRCNIYLFANNEESYAISRNGHRIELNLSEIYDGLRQRLGNQFDWQETKLLIIDGELMPWSALGEGLIQEFRLMGINVDKENEFLSENGFTEAYEDLCRKYEESGFAADKNILAKGKMAEKYGNALYESYKAIDGFKGYLPVEESKRLNEIYKTQLDIYGTKAAMSYKPFAILKEVHNTGEEVIYYRDRKTEWTNETMFNLLNEDGCHRYDISKEEDTAACIRQFYAYTTEEKYEGVVLKPNSLDCWKAVPYIKVRNPNYLTIIYGHDYLTGEKHKRLCSRKSIKGKLRTSLSEWKKGLAMLAIRYDEISMDNERLKQLYASFLCDEGVEKELDPRL